MYHRNITCLIPYKTEDDLPASISLSGFTPVSTASIYRFTEDNLAAIVQGQDLPVSAGIITDTFPASSITIVVVESKG